MMSEYEKSGKQLKKPPAIITGFSGSPLGIPNKAMMPQTMVNANEFNSRQHTRFTTYQTSYSASKK
jgi:hypothetical protein